MNFGPQLAGILPGTALMFILFFSILAPLALYRGPLNVWGLGLGIGAIMLSTGKLSAFALMINRVNISTVPLGDRGEIPFITIGEDVDYVQDEEYYWNHLIRAWPGR